MGLADDCEQEVRELHAFFEDWFTGALPEADAAFDRFEDALGPGFRIVSPDGDERSRTDILEAVWAGHGDSETFDIQVRNVQPRYAFDERCLLRYEEWQADGERDTGRVSTVLFERDETAPGGVAWLDVHETWLDGPD
jgi:hypothetical protein